MLNNITLKNLKIGAKFNLLLILVFIASILGSGLALSSLLQARAQNEVTSQAQILIQMVNAVRNYTQVRIDPLLEPRLETNPTFMPEIVPTFSSKEVFENFRKKPEYKNFFHKDATLNPTNLADKADSFETELVERFRNEAKTLEITGFRSLPEGEVFYIAQPLKITQQQCLRCHSTPEQAPKSQLATYGSENGFGWKLNDIVSAQIISVPSEEIFANAKRTWILIMGLLIAIFALIIFLINFLIKKAVIQRIKRIEKIAQRVSTGDMTADFEEISNDEIGGLAEAFNRMKSSLRIAMDMLNNQS
ncbi:Histidine kinase [Nostoc sp. DSM 114161]|jgi:HAMP domain-containing protein|uniref:c-type heme family protein n=1 Tax=Nostoc sp. DSM 114161 TaxID=3440143 RepID=UPI0040456EE7